MEEESTAILKDILLYSKELLEKINYLKKTENSYGFTTGQLKTLAEFYVQEVQHTIAILQEFSFEYLLPGDLGDGITDLIEVLSSKLNFLHELAWQQSSADYVSMPEGHHGFRCPQEVSGRKGRPSYIVQEDQIQGLRNLGFTWKSIAEMLSISERTLRNKRKDMDITETFSEIEDMDLDNIINALLLESPNMGERLLSGALRGRGIRVQRRRMRESVSRVDPLGKVLRRLRNLKRRRYCVEGANALWHIDSHHKLIRWRMVIHGCIDGFSRLIIYLYGCDNNCAQTVAGLFSSSTNSFYWPRRVRSDQGMENIGVARLMLSKYGTESCPHLTGLSVHNQRIERLWRDVVNYVVGHFRDLFYHMEEVDILAPLNEVHLLALQVVYIPRLNKALEEFRAHWNNHPLRTEHSRTPMQLWLQDVYRRLQGDTVREMMNIQEFDPLQYGVDDQDTAFPETVTNNNVVIPRHPFDFNEVETTTLAEFDPFATDDNYGIEIYLALVETIQGFQSVISYYQ